MVGLYLSITYSQIVELKNHLRMNGYHVVWETNNMMLVDKDELAYVETILADRGIGFTECLWREKNEIFRHFN